MRHREELHLCNAQPTNPLQTGLFVQMETPGSDGNRIRAFVIRPDVLITCP